MDGPDGLAYYWHDVRKEPRYFSTRNFAGGSVMFWGAFSWHGKVKLANINSRINSKGYQEILKDHLLPYIGQYNQVNFTIMHDNAPIHTSESTRRWLRKKNVSVLEWPARSPDLNPIE